MKDTFFEFGELLARKAREPDIAGYKPAPQQLEFHQSKKKQRIVLGGNRCLAEGTKVRMANGKLKNIEAILPGEKILAVNQRTLRLEESEVLEIISNGIKECITYSLGNMGVELATITCTPDHKILIDYESHGGYTKTVDRVDRLNSKRVGALRSLGAELGTNYDEWAMLLGYLIANGSTTQPSVVQLTCADPSVIEEMIYPDGIYVEQQKNEIQYVVKPLDAAREYLDVKNIWMKYSHEKMLPSSVNSWNNKAVSELLGGLFAGDGSFYIAEGKFAKACYTSTSLKLIKQIKRLLELRFGIYGSKIKEDIRANKRICYNITFGTFEALSGLAKLPIPGVKKKRVQEILNFCEKRGSRSSRVKLISCKPAGNIFTYDLSIAHPDHLFLLKGGLAVHNSGKSYSSVVEMIWWATGTHPYRETPRAPVRLRHVAVDAPQGINKVLKELYSKLCPASYLRGGNFDKAWQKEPPTLHFSNGSFVEFLSYEQDLDKHAGTSRHAIAFDEEPDEAIFSENLARLIDTDGEWWIAMTPLEGLTWVFHTYYEPFEQGILEEATEIFKFRSKDNIYLPEGAFDRLLANLTPEEIKARGEGDFIALTGLVYSAFKNTVHVKELEPQKNMMSVACMDHGLRNPTAWLWFQVDFDGTFYFHREHYQSELLVSEHAQAIKVIESSNPLLKPNYRIGDPSIQNRNPLNGQSVQTEYANYGIHIGLGNNDMQAGINRVAQLFTVTPPAVYIDPSCRYLIRELRKYRWDEWSSRKSNTTKGLKTIPKKKDDHALDAFRYGIMSRPLHDGGRGPSPTIDYMSMPVDPQLYATPTLHKVPSSDYRDEAYDSELGSEW